ncbi:glutamyl-tRNA reductase [Arthrobacter sp. Bz4]|uniref:glutamyl-tRNA reductase n=1 Tax=Arthrobacter sp. Bz4 TaxID=2171979 RepID=UPI000D51DCCF|nr:glutamyl-tRNA reductase [Arthrobacter sp. Bz4]PVE14960.1 glutamyl-tRNA reductase [Arthrobacter sp. Bz4]
MFELFPAGLAHQEAENHPRLFVLIARYRDLDIDSAAQLHLVSAQITGQLSTNSDAVSGSAILSTCNRFEIYCEVGDAKNIEGAYLDALAAVSRCSGLTPVRLASLFVPLWGPSVAEHLFGVATGLQSIVAGEHEIAGQVRRALFNAQRAGTTSGLLIRLFEAASRVAKEVGARTALSDSSRSIAAVALDLVTAGPYFPVLADASVIVFGTGAYASRVLNILQSRGCSDVSVFSRSGRADTFVANRGNGVTAVTSNDLAAAVARSDLLIGCSGVGTRFVQSELACEARPARRPLTIVDLVPSRDFDPLVAEQPGVTFISLESVRRAAPKADAAALVQARGLVQQAVQRFEEQERSRVADVVIVALRQHVQGILDLEMERVMRQHGSAATAEQTNAALRRMVQQFLHVPTLRAKELAAAGRQDEFRKALDVLFGISSTGAKGEGRPGNDRPSLSHVR